VLALAAWLVEPMASLGRCLGTGVGGLAGVWMLELRLQVRFSSFWVSSFAAWAEESSTRVVRDLRTGVLRCVVRFSIFLINWSFSRFFMKR
jgi:hypothetical protein